MTAGYSGTPLAAKLGIKPGSRVHVVGAPRPYRDLIAPAPDGITLARALDSAVDVIHVFETRRSGLAQELDSFLRAARTDAVLWISWPKKSSKVRSEITEDTIRELALPLGLVDIKVCAVDATWSGLKLVRRRELRVKP
jgi:hypothetical protein